MSPWDICGPLAGLFAGGALSAATQYHTPQIARGLCWLAAAALSAVLLFDRQTLVIGVLIVSGCIVGALWPPIWGSWAAEKKRRAESKAWLSYSKLYGSVWELIRHSEDPNRDRVDALWRDLGAALKPYELAIRRLNPWAQRPHRHAYNKFLALGHAQQSMRLIRRGMILVGDIQVNGEMELPVSLDDIEIESFEASDGRSYAVVTASVANHSKRHVSLLPLWRIALDYENGALWVQDFRPEPRPLEEWERSCSASSKWLGLPLDLGSERGALGAFGYWAFCLQTPVQEYDVAPARLQIHPLAFLEIKDRLSGERMASGMIRL